MGEVKRSATHHFLYPLILYFTRNSPPFISVNDIASENQFRRAPPCRIHGDGLRCASPILPFEKSGAACSALQIMTNILGNLRISIYAVMLVHWKPLLRFQYFRPPWRSPPASSRLFFRLDSGWSQHWNAVIQCQNDYPAIHKIRSELPWFSGIANI